MTTGANPEIDFMTRIANLETVCFGGPNPSLAFPYVAGALGSDPILYSYSNGTFAYTSFGTAITMLPASTPAGAYQAQVYGVITTTITTATSWLFKLGFTDDQQAQTPTIATSSTMTAGTAISGSYFFRSNGSAAITFTPSYGGSAPGAGVVAASLVLQRLQ